MRKLRYVAGGTAMIALLPTQGLAQEAEAQDEEECCSPLPVSPPLETEIVVTATGIRTQIRESGQAIRTFGLSEIESSQLVDIAALLERSAGVTISRNGAVGGFTGVRVRGAAAEQLVVLIDGVRVSDPAAPGGGFDFGNLGTAGFGKVELLRGANSLIWGSDAIGGVLSVETRKGNYGLWTSAEYGSFDSKSLDAVLAKDIGPANIRVAGGWRDSDGFSSFAGGAEPDGFRQYFAHGSGNIKLADNFSLVVSGRYADSRTEIDGFPFPAFAFADTSEFQESEQWSGYVGAEFSVAGIKLSPGFAISDTSRDNFNPAFGNVPTFVSDGRLERFTLKGQAGLSDRFEIIFGLDSENSSYQTGPFGNNGETGIDSAHALLVYEYDQLNIAAGLRIDDHQTFGSELTFGANASYGFDGEWRLRASFGEGFKAPTLFQLLSDFGNANLRPETSRSYDIGLEYDGYLGSGKLEGAVTLFHRDTKNQIDFISCFGVTDPICDNRPFGTFDNIGRTRAQGVEAELALSPVREFRLQAAYSYIDAENRNVGSPNFGNLLARRPKHALTLSADWEEKRKGRYGEYLKGIRLGADIRMVSDSFDNAANTRPLDGYALVTLRAAYPVTEAIEIYGRVENLFDAQYQTVADYGTAGRSAYAGIRARF